MRLDAAHRAVRAARRELYGVLEHHGVETWEELPHADAIEQAELLAASTAEVRLVVDELERAGMAR